MEVSSLLVFGEEALKLLVTMEPAGLEDGWLLGFSESLHAVMGYPDVRKAKAVEEGRKRQDVVQEREPRE